MSKYAIKKLSRKRAAPVYYPMRKGWLWGWNYMSVVNGMSANNDAFSFLASFSSELEARNFILKIEREEAEKAKRKIDREVVKTEIKPI
jgi:hypothetical protein